MSWEVMWAKKEQATKYTHDITNGHFIHANSLKKGLEFLSIYTHDMSLRMIRKQQMELLTNSMCRQWLGGVSVLKVKDTCASNHYFLLWVNRIGACITYDSKLLIIPYPTVL